MQYPVDRRVGRRGRVGPQATGEQLEFRVRSIRDVAPVENCRYRVIESFGRSDVHGVELFTRIVRRHLGITSLNFATPR